MIPSEKCQKMELFRQKSVFNGQLMSRDVWLKAMEPQWLADEIRLWHEEATKIYEE